MDSAGTPTWAPKISTLSEASLSRFHIAALVFQRARQIQAGARPRVDGAGHRTTRIALLEVLADTVSWTAD